MKTGVNAIDSDDEEEQAIQDKKEKFKRLDVKKGLLFFPKIITRSRIQNGTGFCNSLICYH